MNVFNKNNFLKAQEQKLEEKQKLMKAKLDALKTVRQEDKNNVLSKAFRTQRALDNAEPTASTITMAGEGMKNYKHPLEYLTSQNRMLQNNINSLDAQLQKEMSLYKNAQSQMSQGHVAQDGPVTMMQNLSKGLNSQLMPGNVGDINRVVWPFYFTTSKTILGPNTSTQGNVTITQEAAFIWLTTTKAVFLEEEGVGNAGQFNYIDPEQPGAAGKANNLSYIVRDSQSSRQFMNIPTDMNQVGFWRKPSVLPTPQLILPNSNMEFSFQNNDADATYMPFITMFGLRVRIDKAQDILSLISG